MQTIQAPLKRGPTSNSVEYIYIYIYYPLKSIRLFCFARRVVLCCVCPHLLFVIYSFLTLIRFPEIFLTFCSIGYCLVVDQKVAHVNSFFFSCLFFENIKQIFKYVELLILGWWSFQIFIFLQLISVCWSELVE